MKQETQEGPSWGPLGYRLPVWGALLGRPQGQAEEQKLEPGPQAREGPSARPHYQRRRSLDWNRGFGLSWKFPLLPVYNSTSYVCLDLMSHCDFKIT